MSNHTDQAPDPDFESRVKRVLAEQGDDVPMEVAERLTAMRRAAVAELDERTQRRFRFGWAPAGALAAALATVVLAAGLFLFAGNASVPAMPALTDEPEFAAAQDLELLDELEFLAWLEEESSDAG